MATAGSTDRKVTSAIRLLDRGATLRRLRKASTARDRAAFSFRLGRGSWAFGREGGTTEPAWFVRRALPLSCDPPNSGRLQRFNPSIVLRARERLRKRSYCVCR